MITTGYTDCPSVLSPAKIGAAEIVIDSPSGLDRIRGSMEGQPLTKSRYARLLVNGKVIMTDAEFEQRTNRIVFRAGGDALVAGLGLGMILQPLLDRCNSVTVIEKSKDVIALVGPAFPRCRIIEGDIFEWQPENGTTYDFIYFDIWGDFSEDDLEDSEKLHKKFKRRLRRGGTMASWVATAIKCSRR
jgi:SAM-dependent methyltransferase